MREEILKLCAEILPNIDFESSDTLVDDGTLDSLSIMTLVQELSLEYDVKFDMANLEASQLNSIDAIVNTVKQLQNR